MVQLFGLLMPYSAEGVDHSSAKDPSEVIFGPNVPLALSENTNKKGSLDKLEIIKVAPPQAENKIFSLSTTIFD